MTCGTSIDCAWTCPGCEPPRPNLHSCGYPEDSFACKIRHLSLQTGDAKAANDFEDPNG